jgi:hypothetical protein
VQPQPGGGLSVAPPPALVDAAQRQLAAYLKQPAEQVVLQSANKQTWHDGALGCPQAGMAYPQVVTEGFLLVFTNPDQTQSYAVHTAMSPAAMVLCQAGQPIDLVGVGSAGMAAPAPGAAQPAGAEANHLVDLARAALAGEIGVKAEEITLLSVEEMDWNDSSLGCPKPGQAYLQVITPGYKIILEAQGRRYEYHSGRGERVIRCDLLG